MKRQVMRRAWAICKTAAERYGGKASQYIAGALRQAWAEIDFFEIRNTFTTFKRADGSQFEIRLINGGLFALIDDEHQPITVNQDGATFATARRCFRVSCQKLRSDLVRLARQTTSQLSGFYE